MALPFVQSLSGGVFVIDTGFHRPMFDASFLLVEDGRAAFIDTGTNFAVPRLLAALADLGLAPAAVDYVIPTHVHLDHAGGAGLLMQSLPNATLLVHPRGARHMIDPQALYQGALAVYGQAEMDSAYGSLVAVPAERVQATASAGSSPASTASSGPGATSPTGPPARSSSRPRHSSRAGIASPRSSTYAAPTPERLRAHRWQNGGARA